MTSPLDPPGGPSRPRLFATVQPYVPFGSTVVVGLVLAVCAWAVGPGSEERAVSFAILALGLASGSALGVALSPHDEKESKRFASYWRGLVAFASGYLASKAGPFVDAALSSPSLRSPGPLAAFRLIGFAAMTLIVARLTFSCRSYDDPSRD